MPTTSKKGNGQMLRRDITYRVASHPTNVKVRDVLAFVEKYIDHQRLPKAVRNSICIKSSLKLRKAETEIAIRGSLDHRYGTSSDFERIAKLVRRVSQAVEKKFFQ